MERIKRLLIIISSVILVLIVIPHMVISAEKPPKGKQIVLKAVCHSPLDQVQSKGFLMFADAINKELKGELVIESRGGPSVMSAFEIHEAAKSGAIDIASTSCSYYAPLVKGISQAIMFTNLSEEELVTNTEYYDHMVKVHEKIGLRYLGDSMPFVKFFVYTNKKVQTLGDLTGQKIRGFKALIPFIKALGAAPVAMPPQEVYTAMERGVIDGYIKDVTGVVTERHLDEVTKYIIGHGFYRGTLNILMNLNKWNSLPDRMKHKILEIKTKVNHQLIKYFEKRFNDDWQLIVDSPIEVIQFTKSDEKEFLKRAYDSAWETILKEDPQLGPVLKKILYKQ